MPPDRKETDPMTRAARWTSLLALLLLALPLAAQAAAPARPDPEQLFAHPRQLARFLKLTPEQQTTFKQLYDQLQATLKPLREQQRALYQQLHDQLEAEPQNACAIGETEIGLYQGRGQIRVAFETFDEAFSAILTPEQLAKWNALKDALKFLRGGDDA
jgi:Spy/CpxP family protein refolding chaperone